MDYDENDFHSQNFQLVGEENKFPSSLRSFAVPKFDFDDHLQVHLRFDSLVDTEVLLGIPGQDNNWIEDFSSGTSAIEFSSTAADNHSISRHNNNVWSEATSSESVEMLLRSVGEDDMSDKKAIAMEADARNELHEMINPRGSPSRQVEDNSMLSDIIENIPSVPPGTLPRNVLGLDEDATVDHAQVEGLSQIFSSEISRSKFVASSFSNKIQSDGNVCPVDNNSVKSSDVHGCEESEVASGTSDSIGCRSARADHSSGHSNLVMGSGNLNDQLLSEHLVEEHSVISITERSDMLSDDVHKERSLMAIDSKGNDFVTEGSSSFMDHTKDSIVLISEGCSTGFSGSSDGLLEAIAYQVKVSNNDSEAVLRSSSQADETNSLAIDRKSCIETESIDVGNRNLNNEHIDSNDKSALDVSEMSVEVSAQVNGTQDEIVREAKYSNIGSRNPEPVVVEKSVETDGVEEVEKVDSKLASEGIMIGESILPGVSNTEVKISSSFPDESHQAAEPSDVPTPSLEVSISPDPTNLNNDDNAILEKAEDATCSGQIDDVGDTSIPIAKKLIQDGRELVIVSDPPVTDLSSSGGMIEEMSAPKEDSLDESVKFHQSQDISLSDVVLEQKERDTLPSSEFIQSENKCSIIKSEGKVDGQGSSRPLEMSDIGGISPVNNTKEPQANNLDQSSSCMVSSVASQSELHVLVDKTITQEQTVEVVENIVICDSAVKGQEQSDKTDGSSHENKETAYSLPDTPVSLSTNTSSSLPGSCADVHLLEVDSSKLSLPEPSCGSPTVISCIEHSHDEPEGGNVDIVKSTALDSRESSAFEDDRSFTFEVGTAANRSGKDAGNEWKSISRVQASHPPKENSEVIRKICNENKSSNEDKASHITGSSVEKLTTPKGKSGKGTSTRKKSTNSDRKSSNTSSTPVRIVSSGTKLEEVQRSPFVQTSTLPDLNSSVSSITSFHQPFTDIQQVQLRAQIFVYGSLIQGIPPDEACMQSAFGELDKGRSLWESVWHICVERYQSQKSPVNSETPLRSHSTVRIPEQVTRPNTLRTKAASSSLKNAGKSVPSAILNSAPPLPSPLWSISTHDALHSNFPRGAQLDFNQSLSPLHACPPSQTRQYTSSSTPWLSQNPRPGPWAVSAHSQMLNASAQYSPLPIVEAVKVTPVKDSSMSRAANIQLVSPSSLLPTQTPASVPPASVVQSETQRKTTILGNSKSRKRKKATGAEDLSQASLVSQSTTEPASATTIISASIPSALSGFPFSTVSPAKVSSEAPLIGSVNSEQRIIFAEKTGTKIEEAKLQAAEAATLAASAISSNQGIWNKLAVERNSEFSTEVEEKLASAAVAASAAASVAKAAAAAAKIASDAALQAKTIAEEALDFDAAKNSARLPPGSVVKGKEKIHVSGSIISAAHEATRRRVEAASAAAKRAENLDAIMKAAEMAAEAVYQVGTIIAMGDPLPFKLSDLVEAGPDGYWKVHRSTAEKEHKDEHTPLNSKQIQTKSTEDGRNQDKESMQTKDSFVGHGSGAGNTSTIPNDSLERENFLSNLKENAILQGSLVEVLSDEDGLRGGWFSARVVDVKDNKACVCYNNLLSDDGSGQLKEWISLDSESNGAPRIRIAHPITGTKSDGSKKRRREAVGTYVWEVGDRVDAWMRDGWWEGVVTEKSQVDDTKLTVHFPAGGDSLLVRAWDLRPSLTWKDGQWIEWSRTRENTLKLYEGDTPREKRQKFGGLETITDIKVDNKGMDKLSSKIPPEEPRKVEELLPPLNLSAKDKIFSVGKNTTSKDNISDALKVKRTGLQKEGSRVVFGVPKPGKKRKFMEVSKHYVSDKTEATQENNDSLKFAKYLMPQTSRPWRNTTKVDAKGKPAGDSKSVGGKPVKSQTTQTRKTSEKDNSSNGRNNSRGTSPSMGGGVNNAENSANEVVSFSGSLRTTESLVAGSSVQSVHTVPSSKKKPSSSVDADTGVKRRPVSASEKSIRGEEKPSEDAGKIIPGTAEPRRSNRRIQPTSRLLEGLQSSLIISKIPSFSHDKGSKTQHRGSSSRGNARG